MKLAYTVLKNLRTKLYSYEYKITARKRAESFTRESKMNFAETMLCILKSTKTGVQAGVNTFLDQVGKESETYTKQAFSKRRQEIKPEAILELIQDTVNTFYHEAPLRNWHGYQLMAIDGTRLNLPCTEELRAIFGEQVSQGPSQVQMLCSTMYDVLNDFAVDIYLGGCKDSERDHAAILLQRFQVLPPEQTIILMDRGYPSAALLDLLDSLHFKYLIRYSEEFACNMQITGDDCVVEHKFAKLDHILKLRAVSVDIGNTTEHLLTNLFDSELDKSAFKELYRQRWGIETGYDILKNVLEIENFSGVTATAVMQDCYASVFLYNLAGVIAADCKGSIEAKHNKPTNMYTYKLSLKAVILELREHVVEMILADSRRKCNKILKHIAFRLQNAVVPVRPGRSFPRKRKHNSAKFSQNTK